MRLEQENLNIRTAWKTAVLISLAVCGTYLFISTRTTLWDRDEPRFCRAVVEMLQSGNYLVPTFNGQIWFDKPILFYWLMSLSVRLFGPTEFACRFFGAIGTALSCLLTFFIGLRLLGAKAGLYAMIILASTLMILVIGSAATIDAVLLPINLSVLAIFVQTTGRPMHIRHIILMGIALGAGLLAKGPIGLMPVVVMATVVWLNRKNQTGASRYIWQIAVAVAIGIAIFAAWAIPADKTTGGEFFKVFIGKHVLTRAFKPMEHHGGHFLIYLPYYLPVILAGFFPWTLFLPGAVSAVAGGRIGGQNCRTLLIGWVTSIVIVMTLAATKLPHYILFIWPAMALMVAGTIVAAEQNILAVIDKKWLRGGVWFFGPLTILIAAALIAGPGFVPAIALRIPATVAGIILLAMSVIAVRLQLADKLQVAAKVLFAGMIIFLVPVLFGVLPAVEKMKIAPPIARAIGQQTSEETPVASYKFGEPTLNFYLGRQIEQLRSPEAVVAYAGQPKQGVLVITRDALDEIQRQHGQLPLEQIASKKGFNYSKGKTLEVLALVRKQKD